ncbi:uncharacterized protein BDW70DRAFT_130141 [Aspergillus foveolatus]|uniref:uncharacterized protein n=1 Tax=Aspergillus foveolatus TaxID=210207 RepID=UPI003CCCF740
MRTVSRCMPHMGAVSGPNRQVRALHCSLNKASGSPVQNQLRMACGQRLHLLQYLLLFYLVSFARRNTVVVRRRAATRLSRPLSRPRAVVRR